MTVLDTRQSCPESGHDLSIFSTEVFECVCVVPSSLDSGGHRKESNSGKVPALALNRPGCVFVQTGSGPKGWMLKMKRGVGCRNGAEGLETRGWV